MENQNSKIKGWGLLIKPGETEVEKIDIEFESNENDLNTIINIVSDDPEKNPVSCVGRLPLPLNDFTGFILYDQVANEYNMGLMGIPIFGPILVLELEIESEEGKIIPITTEEQFDKAAGFFTKYKEFEIQSGVYEAIKNLTKNTEDRMAFVNRLAEDSESVEDVKTTTEIAAEEAINKKEK